MVHYGGSARTFITAVLIAAAGCSQVPRETAATAAPKPADSQHAGITTPHGDHSPHHGGLVLMQGELHYEVVLDPKGRHAVWFSDAVREDLPASVASKVEMTVIRPNGPPEQLVLSIDDSGESWITNGQPVSGTDVDLTAATRVAIQEMVDFLAATKKMDKHQAYQLTSLAGDVAITQLVDGTMGVHVKMPKSIFK